MGSKADLSKRHLDAWRTSGLTQVAYRREPGLSLACFGCWRRRLRKATTSTALVPIVIGQANCSDADATIEVQLPNGLRARLSVGMPASHWAPLVRALRAC